MFRSVPAIETHSRNTIPGIMRSHDTADLHMCIPNCRNLPDLICLAYLTLLSLISRLLSQIVIMLYTVVHMV